MSSPRLSICMIVRDEAALLPAFLEHAEGLWDELIVVDTGSVDDTAALAAAAGATVVHHPWQDNFSEARNVSLQHATGDWILVLDADEHPNPAFVTEARGILGRSEVGAATVVIRNLFANGHHRDSVLLRMFRRDPAVRYEHRIHEDLSRSLGEVLARDGRTTAALKTPIDHHGYTRERAAEKEKRERDAALLQQAITENPSDIYSRFKLLELARFWSDSALGERAAAETLSAIEAGLVRFETSHVGGELLVLLAGALHPGAPEEALRLVEQWTGRIQPSAAFHLGRGLLREQLGDAVGARSDFELCLEWKDPTAQLVTTRPLLGLARLAMARGDFPEARVQTDKALAHSPLDPEALLSAIALRVQAGSELEDFVASHPSSPQLWVALRQVLEIQGMARLSARRFTEAYELLARFVDQVPHLALGMVVCDLLLGRSSDLEVDLDLDEASVALRGWVESLARAKDPSLLQDFVAVMGAIEPMFPWLDELRSE